MQKEEIGLALLRKPFPQNQISKLPKPYKKDSPKGNCKECGGYHGLPAIHIDYVGHAALTDRLLDADPNWRWEPLATGPDGLPFFDKTGGLWIKLTVCSVTRYGYGNATTNSYADIGSREKEVIGDALRNAAMRFGAALDLWHKGCLHIEEDTSLEENSWEEKNESTWDNEEMLSVFRQSSMEGMKALRSCFAKHNPPEEWWTENAKSFKVAAKKADEENNGVQV